MTDHPTNLDEHRGLIAQKETRLRRGRASVEADQARLKAQREALEDNLLAAPAADWSAAVRKASYLLTLFARRPGGVDPRHLRLIDNVMADFARLLEMQRTRRLEDD